MPNRSPTPAISWTRPYKNYWTGFHHREGFTLVEVLAYTAFVAMIMVSLIMLATAMFQSRARVHSALVLNENLRFALTRIVGRVTEASGVTAPASGSSTALTLSTNSPSENPTVIALNSGAVTLTQGGGSADALTSNEIEVTNLSFARLSGTPAAIRIDLVGQLRNASGPFQSSLSLSATAVIRR